jgi:hypothetical protein
MTKFLHNTILLSLLGLAFAACADQGIATAKKYPVPEHLNDEHPVGYWSHSQKLVQAKNMEDATFLFYAGQLRYRIFLDCEAAKPSPEDHQAFGALLASYSPVINNWAWKDLESLIQTIDDVLVWDEVTEDGFVDKDACDKARQKNREGLINLQNIMKKTAR